MFPAVSTCILRVAGCLAVVGVAVLGTISGQPAHSQDRVEQPGWHMWGPRGGWREQWQHEHMTPRHRHRMQRHWTFMNGNIPRAYVGLKNPLDESDETIARGEKLYAANCARCHGHEGMGEGEAGNDLYPSPALLAFVVQMPIALDSYLMWTVSEGGEDFNTEMPAFKDTLSQGEIWQIIAYMRNGFALP